MEFFWLTTEKDSQCLLDQVQKIYIHRYMTFQSSVILPAFPLLFKDCFFLDSMLFLSVNQYAINMFSFPCFW